MADNEQIGLEAIFESEDFQKGIAEYNSAISDAVQTTEDAAGDIEFSFGMLGDEIENIFSGISSSVAISQEDLSVRNLRPSLTRVWPHATAVSCARPRRRLPHTKTRR